jgi:hypothetical protein
MGYACTSPPSFPTIFVSMYERAVSNSLAQPGETASQIHIIRLPHSIRLIVNSFGHVFLFYLQSLKCLLEFLSILAWDSLKKNTNNIQDSNNWILTRYIGYTGQLELKFKYGSKSYIL